MRSSQPPRPESIERLRERLQAVQARARESFAENLATIDEAVDSLRAHALDEPARTAAQRAAHQLAGAAGAFGFPDATAPARHLEEAFAGAPQPDDAHSLEVEAAALRRVLFGDQGP